MTPSQAACLTYIAAHIERTGGAPTYVEIAAAAGLASKSTAHRYVQALIASGRLRGVGRGRARNLEVVDFELPLVMSAMLRRLDGETLAYVKARVDAEWRRRPAEGLDGEGGRA